MKMNENIRIIRMPNRRPLRRDGVDGVDCACGCARYIVFLSLRRDGVDKLIVLVCVCL